MQQAMLSLHRMREQLVKFRTMQINGLRGLLAEYGEVMGTGRMSLNKAMPAVLSRLHGISKRGDTYLRTLLIHGARSVITHTQDPGPWVEEIKKRKSPNVAVSPG